MFLRDSWNSLGEYNTEIFSPLHLNRGPYLATIAVASDSWFSTTVVSALDSEFSPCCVCNDGAWDRNGNRNCVWGCNDCCVVYETFVRHPNLRRLRANNRMVDMAVAIAVGSLTSTSQVVKYDLDTVLSIYKFAISKLQVRIQPL
eukprot:m.184446 g.184446  ORF g.184446 m.184446 type:complete len:145 (-) comp32189_c0_seq2:93-527(-)